MTDRFRVTGLMSGSSMDGTDLACCDFTLERGKWSYQIVATDTIPYPGHLKSKLESACHWSEKEIEELDLELGTYYSELLNGFHASHRLSPDIISSHGHTILHEPAKGITLQAGNGRIMAGITGITTINNFRNEDVSQGGQGAPLVPVGDMLLFDEYGTCVNVGGFANISYDDSHGTRIAYDLCPANMALNWIASLMDCEFDKDGAMAKQGQVDPYLLGKLNSLLFYSAKPPKSLGREWFLENFLPLLENRSDSANDLMATAVEHIAIQISTGINAAHKKTVLLTGGGAMNLALVDRLQFHSNAKVILPPLQLIHYKEAVIFAFLGLLKSRGEINCLASVTGGRQDLSAGSIYQPEKIK